MSSDKEQNSNYQDYHWADVTASRIIKAGKQTHRYTLASGITPSGTVHIGNFREVITVDLVKRALQDKGENVRFLFSWDDFDVFRKIPQNMPQQGMLKSYLGKSINIVPDPFEKEVSYARHHEAAFENSLFKVGIFPEFVYQNEKYRQGDYVQEIKTAIEKKKVIMAILNVHRREPLGENWYPVSVFCSQCGGDDTQITDANTEMVFYNCSCGHNESVEIDTADNLKLPWRIDWPMRWAYERVDFEPGGKDHSSEGGSFDTAKEIVKEVYDKKSPIYIPYDFISIKGKGGKMSSSSGDVITLDDVLGVYTPEIVRWIFASNRNNMEFSISFDLDVIKNYEAFDRLERVYYGLEVVSKKNLAKLKRIYELSQISDNLEKIPEKIPFRASFRHLTNLIQIYDFSLDRVIDEYQNYLNDDFDKEIFVLRFHCACNWIREYAPEDFKFSLNKEKNIEILDKYEEKYRFAINKFGNLLKSSSSHLEEEEIAEHIYRLIEEFQLDIKVFFELIYLVLIGKKKGPKLSHFLKIIDKKKLIYLL